MNGALARRVLLALIPVALLSTSSLALSGLTPLPQTSTDAPQEEPAQPEEVRPPRFTSAAPGMPGMAPDNEPAQPEQVVQATEEDTSTVLAQIAEEPLPELVVDRTALNQALAELDRAAEQAKLAVTALDADAQRRYIQETINLLAGSGDAAFRPVTPGASAAAYRGVRPLLIEARVVREAAEVQWIAAVQRQLEARSKRLAEIVQAGAADGTVPAPPPPLDLNAVVGPTGVLGTRGVRPEDQAAELVTKAIRQAGEALRLVPAAQHESVSEAGPVTTNSASDQATQAMEWVVKLLESARKIVQIAVDR